MAQLVNQGEFSGSSFAAPRSVGMEGNFSLNSTSFFLLLKWENISSRGSSNSRTDNNKTFKTKTVLFFVI